MEQHDDEQERQWDPRQAVSETKTNLTRVRLALQDAGRSSTVSAGTVPDIVDGSRSDFNSELRAAVQLHAASIEQRLWPNKLLS